MVRQVRVVSTLAVCQFDPRADGAAHSVTGVVHALRGAELHTEQSDLFLKEVFQRGSVDVLASRAPGVADR